MNTKKVSEVSANDVIVLDTKFYGVSKDEECKVLKVNEGVSFRLLNIIMKPIDVLIEGFGLTGKMNVVLEVQKITGFTLKEIGELDAYQQKLGFDKVYSGGWFAGRTYSLEHLKENVFPKNIGKVAFWSGYISGIKHCIDHGGKFPFVL